MGRLKKSESIIRNKSLPISFAELIHDLAKVISACVVVYLVEQVLRMLNFMLYFDWISDKFLSYLYVSLFQPRLTSFKHGQLPLLNHLMLSTRFSTSLRKEYSNAFFLISSTMTLKDEVLLHFESGCFLYKLAKT